MARRRAFNLDVVGTKDFLSMPPSTRALYFHLGMRADDDGFLSNPKRVTMIASASQQDFDLLIEKGYAVSFESGVVALPHWPINNRIRKERYTATRYSQEKELLKERKVLMKKNGK